MGLPPYPTPTSPALSDSYYPLAQDIAAQAVKQLGVAGVTLNAPIEQRRLDQPNASFKGPF
jgi:pyruvate dehydrogenase E1 component beta subunit